MSDIHNNQRWPMMGTLFQLTDHRRKLFIDGHKFYVDQATKRLISQFQDIEAEAKAFGDNWLNNASQYFDPERHDPDAFHEQAYEESIEFYQKLSDMRNRTLLTIVGGIYHDWDKQLRSWLIGEVHHWHRGERVERAIWSKNFDQIIELLEAFGCCIKNTSFCESLNRCRLVVNAYKHGHGSAFDKIKRDHPEFIETFGAKEPLFLEHADYDALKVDESHIEEFSNAIIEFWGNIPEDVFRDKLSDFPDWFHKAMEADLSQDAKGIKK